MVNKELICPPLPVSDGVQASCWKVVLIIGYVYYFIYFIICLATENFGGAFFQVFSAFLFTMYQYHSLYFTIEVGDETIHIKGGPCQWCSKWNNDEDPKRYLSAAWCFSSTIKKSEITGIKVFDIDGCYPYLIPRCYCMPIMWGCCHKSYSGWYCCCCCQSPFCLCCFNNCSCITRNLTKCNVLGICDGDVTPSSDMNTQYVQFNLSVSTWDWKCPKRISLNILSACSYNRIGFVIRGGTDLIVDQLKDKGYNVRLLGTSDDALERQATKEWDF